MTDDLRALANPTLAQLSASTSAKVLARAYLNARSSLEAAERTIEDRPTWEAWAAVTAALEEARNRLAAAEQRVEQARIAEGEMRLVLESTEHKLGQAKTDLIAAEQRYKELAEAAAGVVKGLRLAAWAHPGDEHPDLETLLLAIANDLEDAIKERKEPGDV